MICNSFKLLSFNWLATDLVMKIQDCVEVWYHVQVIFTAVLSEILIVNKRFKMLTV